MSSIFGWIIEKLADKRRVTAVVLMALNAALVVLKRVAPELEIPGEFVAQVATLVAGAILAAWSKIASMKTEVPASAPPPTTPPK